MSTAAEVQAVQELQRTNLVRGSIRALLEGGYFLAAAYDNPGAWSIQGLGMIRLYLSPEVRLHVWDSRYAVPGVSTLHDHPWHLHSRIVAGAVHQYRFTKTIELKALVAPVPVADLWKEQTILCGEGGGLCGVPTPVALIRGAKETYRAGEVYQQTADEIHESMPEGGTVTLVTREFLEDAEHAHVYFKDEWVTAEPRPATASEVAAVLGYSLQRWF